MFFFFFPSTHLIGFAASPGDFVTVAMCNSERCGHSDRMAQSSWVSVRGPQCSESVHSAACGRREQERGCPMGRSFQRKLMLRFCFFFPYRPPWCSLCIFPEFLERTRTESFFGTMEGFSKATPGPQRAGTTCLYDGGPNPTHSPTFPVPQLFI